MASRSARIPAPGGGFYDREPRICVDCRQSDEGGLLHGFGSVITHDGQSRIYCSDCKLRRGLKYLFDSRPWRQIASEAA